MTNKEKLLSDDNLLAFCLMCPYELGKDGAACKTYDDTMYKNTNECMECIKSWLNKEWED